MTRTLCFGRIGVFVAVSCLSGTRVHAQVTTADVVGHVTDSSGAALPGATVMIENPATGDVRTLVTDETGDYVFNLLPIGRYTLKVQLDGFSPSLAALQLSA